LKTATELNKLINAVFLLVVLTPFILCGCTPRNAGIPINTGNDTSTWVYPESDSGNPVWGIENGIAFGIQKDGKPPFMDNAPKGTWAPGLLYIMWADDKGKTHFFNYIGFTLLSSRGFEQSEPSRTDFFAENIGYIDKLDILRKHYGESSQEYKDYVNIDSTPPEGLSKAATIDGNVMTVVFRLSEFEKNDTSIYVIVKVNKNRPREIEILAHNMFSETRPLKYLHLSSTAGSLARLRNLFIKNEVVNSKELFKGTKPGPLCFYALKIFSLERLPIDSQGIISVYAGNDEVGEWIGEFGSKTAPFYGRPKFYQYWRKYPGTYRGDLKVTVNGRDRYFSGYVNPCGKEIHGGIVYENFDMAEEYHEGQTFWFGYTYELPAP